MHQDGGEGGSQSEEGVAVARDPAKLLDRVIQELQDGYPMTASCLRSVRDNAAFAAPEMREQKLWREVSAILTRDAPAPPTAKHCPEAWKRVADIWTKGET